MLGLGSSGMGVTGSSWLLPQPVGRRKGRLALLLEWYHAKRWHREGSTGVPLTQHSCQR